MKRPLFKRYVSVSSCAILSKRTHVGKEDFAVVWLGKTRLATGPDIVKRWMRRRRGERGIYVHQKRPKFELQVRERPSPHSASPTLEICNIDLLQLQIQNDSYKSKMLSISSFSALPFPLIFFLLPLDSRNRLVEAATISIEFVPIPSSETTLKPACDLSPL